MTKRTAARAWFGVTALVVLAGLVTQTVVTANHTGGHFTTVSGRLFNLLCFFTIESNIIVMATTALLALDPDRRSTALRAFRLMGVLGITITGIVYHTVLADLSDLQGGAAVADFLLHTASPLLAVAGWLVFGPRGLIDNRTIVLAALFPLLYLVFTLIRGPIVDFYPYPFLDVTDHGYGTVAFNSLIVALLFVVLALAARAVDHALAKRTPVTEAG
ncbi:Pr6Pr family membrane protein [Alloactinosynnema sp. L-07]|uniref:Pr6Pr family membrane protein n=1 Tax=Alloactinosynnema sp. L-07 TaxID=1653480 RepID=UPI0006B65AB4|nr:Pr6Pr family membrane protein [Alloactinosynnema sp. L-07]